MQQTHYLPETQVLHEIAADSSCKYIWTKHALEQMVERGITAADIEHALMNGHVVLIEYKKDILWRVAGKDIDGRDLEAVVAVYADAIEIKVVTAF